MTLPHDTVPLWTWIAPVAACVLLVLKAAHLVPATAPVVLILAAALLAAAVFAAVHHAEVLALRVGEPFGSILLAVAVTVIEVALIASIFLTEAPGSETVARDTVFSAYMIVLNGVIGLALVVGAQRYGEQTFQLQGAAASLAVLGVLAVLALILPNYTEARFGPVYSPAQLVFVASVSLVLYALYLFVQTVRHRDYFLDQIDDPVHGPRPTARLTAISAVLLLAALVAVVLLAKVLTPPLDAVLQAAGLPKAFLGVVIAAVVLLPEGLAAVRAARANRLQNSINLALGSAIASIGLTIPTLAALSLFSGQKLVLGLGDEDIVLLLLTLFVSTLTLGTGRTTVLQGAVHLVIFAVFLLFSAIP